MGGHYVQRIELRERRQRASTNRAEAGYEASKLEFDRGLTRERQ